MYGVDAEKLMLQHKLILLVPDILKKFNMFLCLTINFSLNASNNYTSLLRPKLLFLEKYMEI